MLQAVWRKAHKEGGLLLEFNTQAGAQRARMQLYNAVKLQKSGKDLEDLDLVHAAEQIEIVWADETRTRLRMQPKDKSDMMQGLFKALGATSVQEFVDERALESSERMLRELEESAKAKATGAPQPGEHQDNPFFGKRS
jgi:hypothetical protein